MSAATLTPLDQIDAPYRRVIRLEEATFDSGMKLLRVIVREGHRITQLDIDPATASRWGQTMLDWAAQAPDAS